MKISRRARDKVERVLDKMEDRMSGEIIDGVSHGIHVDVMHKLYDRLTVEIYRPVKTALVEEGIL